MTRELELEIENKLLTRALKQIKASAENDSGVKYTFTGKGHEHAYYVASDTLALPTPSTSGILKLAKAAHRHINKGRNWAILREVAETLTQEEINILEGVEL